MTTNPEVTGAANDAAALLATVANQLTYGSGSYMDHGELTQPLRQLSDALQMILVVWEPGDDVAGIPESVASACDAGAALLRHLRDIDEAVAKARGLV